MRIERYSDEYRDDIQRLVIDFHKESLEEYGMKFDQKALIGTIDAIKDSAFILILDGKAEGMLAGKEVTTPAGEGKFWHEVVWFVNKAHRKYGIKLFNVVKEVLKAEGFTAIVMVYMHNSKSDKLHRFYTRMGLIPMETNYIGRL
jgi:hypothetical protein